MVNHSLKKSKSINRRKLKSTKKFATRKIVRAAENRRRQAARGLDKYR